MAAAESAGRHHCTPQYNYKLHSTTYTNKHQHFDHSVEHRHPPTQLSPRLTHSAGQNACPIKWHITNYDDGAMPSPAADRRMKTSTMLLLNFILHPSQQSLQVCLLQIRYAYSTKGCWIPFAFIYEQANFWWLVGRTKYVIGSPPPVARVPANGAAHTTNNACDRWKRAFYVFNFTTL